jgi:hypothetical protein
MSEERRHDKRYRRDKSPTPEQLEERFKIEGDPEDAVRVLLGVPPKEPVEVPDED